MELNLLNLLAVLLVAWVAGLLARRLGYPSVLGELLAGVALGPPLLGILQTGPALEVLAEVGILLMMLYIGMEVDPHELGKASKAGLLAAIGGFVIPFEACYWIMIGAGMPVMAGIFVGIAAGVTSLATKSRVLLDLKLLHTRIAHVMLAGALMTDTVSLVLFGVVLGVAQVGGIEAGPLLTLTAKATLFFVAAILVGTKVLPVLGRQLQRLKAFGDTAAFTLVLLVTLAYAEAAHLAGLHGILGAFLAGLFLRENYLGRTLSHQLMDLVNHASVGFLAPIFFVTAGFAVSLDVFVTDFGLLVALVGAATVTKIFGTMLFYLPTGYGWREGLTVGLGMNGRGAVEIIVAQIALDLGLISTEVFSILVFMAILTTALEPALLKAGIAWLRRRGELAEIADERSGTVVVGGGPTARALAGALGRLGADVRIVDNSAAHIGAAEREGLRTVRGSALDERTLDEAGASHARHLVALTANPEVNVLAAQLARTTFAVPEVFLLDRGNAEHDDPAAHLGAETLFGQPTRLDEWDLRLANGQADVHDQAISAPMTLGELAAAQRGDWLPLALVRDGIAMPVRTDQAFRPGDTVAALYHAAPARRDDFDRLVADAPVCDLDGPLSMGDFAKQVARVLGPQLGVREERLMERLISRETTSSTVILPGLAIPHVRLSGRGTFALLIARCREGIYFPNHDQPVRAAFVIVAAPDVRTRHLRTLSAIAQVVQGEDFEQRWLDAPDAEALRTLVRRAPRRRATSSAPSSTN